MNAVVRGRLYVTAVLLSLTIAVGCTALGVPAPQNTEQGIAYMYPAIATVRDEAAKALQAKKINKSEAQNVLKYTDTARESADLAKGFQAEGLTAKALASLNVAKAVVSQTRQYLGLAPDPKLGSQ